MVSTVNLRSGDVPRLKAAAMALLTAAALTPMENGQMIVHTLYRAPETLPYLWTGGRRGDAGHWRRVAKALVKVYEALANLEAVMNGNVPAGAGQAAQPLGGPPHANAADHLPLAVLQPARLPVQQAAPGHVLTPSPLMSLAAAGSAMAIIWTVIGDLLNENAVLRTLVTIYRCAIYVFIRLMPQAFLAGLLLFGLMAALVILAKPQLLLHAAIWVIKLIPGYLAGVTDAFGLELAAQLGWTTYGTAHCTYDEQWASTIAGHEPMPKARMPTQPTPTPPPDWAMPALILLCLYTINRHGH